MIKVFKLISLFIYKIFFIFSYFSSWENRLSLLILFTFPFISLHIVPGTHDKNTHVIVRLYQYHIAAIGILFTWLVNMINVAHNPVLGSYVQMLVKISFNFFKFFIACFSLVIAFGCSFSILFPREASLNNMMSSPLKECLNSLPVTLEKP